MKEHFEKVFWNEDEHEECEAEGNFHWEEGTDHCGIEPPNETEITTEINRLKNNKSTGENGIPAEEALKCGGEGLKQRIVSLINNVWKKEEMP
ncbi:hypothetical protein QE152_g30284 [Popillia japonica]|uniref:Uncharacterized protein n=1 Tax=Popillia japonica TaxID=7064 RepID=A0AAW1JEX0_POPJA